MKYGILHIFLHTCIVADACGAKSSTISIFHASFAPPVAGRVVWVSQSQASGESEEEEDGEERHDSTAEEPGLRRLRNVLSL